MTPLRTWVAAVVVTALPCPARAACTAPADAKQALRSARKAAHCNDRILRIGVRGTCPVPPPPACAGTLVADATALAYGPNDPPVDAAGGRELAAQRRCQKQIGKGVANYLRALVLLACGRPDAKADAVAGRQLERVAKRCAVTVAAAPSGVVVPQVGGQCAAAVGGAGASVDAPALAACLRQLLRTWVRRVAPEPTPLRPNVVVIVTDDQRWDTTDATHSPGGAFVMARTRAALLAPGVEFRNAFLTTPVCCPSRSSILTGQYAHRHGVYSNGGLNGGAKAFDDANTLGTLLRAAGYRTGFVGKYLNGYSELWDAPPPYVPPGWDEWHAFRGARYFDYRLVRNGEGYDHVIERYGAEPEAYSTDVLREIAKDFVATSVARSTPFFLYFAPKAPHGPWEPAPRHAGTLEHLPPYRPASFDETDVTDKPSWVQALPPFTPDDLAGIDFRRRRQLEMLQAVDEAIGGSADHGIVGLVETLASLGVLEDTIVVYLSDNGFHWGEHRRPTGKLTPYEEAIRTPFFVRYPRLAPLPRTDDRLVVNLDVFATVAELAGVGAPIAQDGTSLVGAVDATARAWRTDVLTEGWPDGREWASVRDAGWKYTELPITPGDPATAFERELYDLENDPFELRNLAGDPAHAARIAAMGTRLRALRPNWPLDADGDVDLPEGEDD